MKIVLGCMEFGRRLNAQDTKTLIGEFLKQNKELDTAYLYNNGTSEKIMGEYQDFIAKNGGIIATKINPSEDGFIPENFVSRFKVSLERLNVPFVDMLYLHWPCHTHEIQPVLQAVNKLYEEGLFKRFGISNYSAWEVYKIHYLCEKHGYIQPSVYQGMYNCLTRDVERELIPCIRDLGISFYAYNPLAGGLLTGRYKYDDLSTFNEKSECRFNVTSSATATKQYIDRFWHKSYFDGIELMQKNLKSDQSLLQASFDWLTHNSQLSSQHGDAIVIGASTLDQFEKNMAALNNTHPLSEEFVNIIDGTYKNIAGCCPNYFR